MAVDAYHRIIHSPVRHRNYDAETFIIVATDYLKYQFFLLISETVSPIK